MLLMTLQQYSHCRAIKLSSNLVPHITSAALMNLRCWTVIFQTCTFKLYTRGAQHAAHMQPGERAGAAHLNPLELCYFVPNWLTY